MKFPIAALGLALLALTTISAADGLKAPTQSDTIDSVNKVITDLIIKPMSKEISDRMMRVFAKNEGVMTPAANEYLKQWNIEEQIAYDEKIKSKCAAILAAKRCKVY